jgi:hypothetical protein
MWNKLVERIAQTQTGIVERNVDRNRFLKKAA